jgi:hypothetical protein
MSSLSHEKIQKFDSFKNVAKQMAFSNSFGMLKIGREMAEHISVFIVKGYLNG